VTLRGWLGVILLIAVVAAGFLAFKRAEGEAPRITAPATAVVGGDGRDIEVTLEDDGAGLRLVRATLRHAGGEAVVHEEPFPGDWVKGGGGPDGPRGVVVRVDPKALGLEDGDAFLVIEARDWSWRDGFSGNRAEQTVEIAVDRKKPRIQVFTGLTYVQRGGSGIVAYATSEPTTRDGVAVGEVFYRGYPHPDDAARRIALYAVPTDAPDKPSIRIEAEDAAGNVGVGRWSVVVKERALPAASVTLPESFLEHTVRELAEESDIDTGDLHEAFRVIYTEMRSANEATIREATAD